MEDFEKLKVLERGTFGIVTLCRSVKLQKKFVLKEIFLDDSSDSKEFSQHEAKLLMQLHYPHIIRYYSSFVHNYTMTLVMEYATHGNLMDYIKHQNGVLLPLKNVLNITSQLLLAVHHIHSINIVHRDIKPQNILLTGKDGQLVKLGDFGISKVMESSLKKAASMVGTLSYMAPELCRGQLYGKQSDLWSLGCVFYTILTLKIAFDAPTLAGVLNKILYGTIKDPIDVQIYDKSFADMVEKMLNREPELRPDTSKLMCNHLIATFILQFVVDFGITFGSAIEFDSR